MKKAIITITLSFVLLTTVFVISLNYINSKSNNVGKDYKIVFRGETIDNIYSTYVYEKVTKKKKKKIITYNYINTIITKNNTDYTYSLEKIVSKGNVKNKDKIIDIVNENGSTTYAEVVKDNVLIQINQYKEYLN